MFATLWTIVLIIINGARGVAPPTGTQSPDTCEPLLSVQRLFGIQQTLAEEYFTSYYTQNIPVKSEYDYVIIGAGPAGCVLANRLSENERNSVLLLEAGNAENPLVTNTPMAAPNLQSTSYNWNYVTEPQKDACLSMNGHRCAWPHGRGLGGSSIINYMIYTRGNRRDFDRWAEAGNPGWRYSDILPLYKKLEKSSIYFSDGSLKEDFGRRGLLTIEENSFRTPIAKAFVDGSMQLNHSHVNYNSGDQIGVSYLQASSKNGWRQTAAKAFLSRIKDRPNLDISLRSWATKLLFNGHHDHVKGVKFYRNRHEYNVKVRKEVIVSAGAFQSPKLLMLSGIGPADHLADLHIDLVKDLPVGETLYEHMAVFGPVFTADNVTDGLINMNSVLQLQPMLELADGKGPFTSTGIEALLYMKVNDSVNADPELPDIELLQSFATIAFDTAHGTRIGLGLSMDAYEAIFKALENRRAFQILPLLLHPRSKGYMKLKSRNPFHHPLLYPNFFSDRRDIESLLQGIREAIKITEQPAFKALGVRLYKAKVPGCEKTVFNTDDYWRCYIRHLSATLHHQIGTCKMGPIADKTTVVDAMGRVHGFQNLRVADVSIIPEPPSGHTAAFSFLIGEKVADIILNERRNRDAYSHVRHVTRGRRMIVDWQYQDPAHIIRIDNGSTTTELSSQRHKASATAASPTMRPMSLEELHAINMSNLHANSLQFRNSTIGDIATILWGSETAQQTVDYKSTLAAHTNRTQSRNVTGFGSAAMAASDTAAQVPGTATTSIRSDKLPSIMGRAADRNADYATVVDERPARIGMQTDGATTTSSTVHVNDGRMNDGWGVRPASDRERIMATTPSVDEDLIKTIPVNATTKRINHKQITRRLKTMAMTKYSDDDTLSMPVAGDRGRMG